MHRPRILALTAAFAAGALLVACGTDDDVVAGTGTQTSEARGSGGHGTDGHHDAPSAVGDGAREIEVVASDFAFDPSEITVDAGEDLAIVLTSEDMLHDLTIDELDAHVAADRGETAAGGLSASEPGTYTYYCSVPGHREAGMEGTLTVR